MAEQILLVDDEPDIRTVAALTLQRVGGFEVRCAASGEEALRMIRAQAPDVVLLDVMMPDLDGPATLRAIRDMPDCAGIAVVMMTARVQRAEVQRWMTLGAAGVIPKPFDPMALPEQVRAILARAR